MTIPAEKKSSSNIMGFSDHLRSDNDIRTYMMEYNRARHDSGQIGPIPLNDFLKSKSTFRPIRKLIFYRHFTDKFSGAFSKKIGGSRFSPSIFQVDKVGGPIYPKNEPKTRKITTKINKLALRPA